MMLIWGLVQERDDEKELFGVVLPSAQQRTLHTHCDGLKPDPGCISDYPARPRRIVRKEQVTPGTTVCQAHQEPSLSLSWAPSGCSDTNHIILITSAFHLGSPATYSHVPFDSLWLYLYVLYFPFAPSLSVWVGGEQVKTGVPAITLMKFTATTNLVLHTLYLIYHFYNTSLWEFMAIYVITQIIQIAINWCNVL